MYCKFLNTDPIFCKHINSIYHNPKKYINKYKNELENIIRKRKYRILPPSTRQLFLKFLNNYIDVQTLYQETFPKKKLIKLLEKEKLEEKRLIKLIKKKTKDKSLNLARNQFLKKLKQYPNINNINYDSKIIKQINNSDNIENIKQIDNSNNIENIKQINNSDNIENIKQINNSDNIENIKQKNSNNINKINDSAKQTNSNNIDQQNYKSNIDMNSKIIKQTNSNNINKINDSAKQKKF